MTPMLLRTALALLLLFPPAASAQDLETAVSALVRISGTKDGAPVRGSGFVVGLDRDKATIVTASHVIEGVQDLQVTFAADLASQIPVAVTLGMEAGSPNGLAALQIRGAVPAGVTALSFAVDSQLRLGDELFLAGFPEMADAPLTPRRALSGRRGTLLLIDQDVGEGFSGGPVLQGGKVVGVVTETDGQTTYAVSAVVAREALKGWGVRPQTSPASPPPPKAAASKPSHRTLKQGTPLRFDDSGVTLSVTFSDERGGLATLRIQASGQPPIVEAVLGPGGQIPFRSRSGEHLLSVVDWNPDEKTLELTIDPGL